MRKIIFILTITALFSGCKKSGENIIWEKSYGTGKAVFVRSMGDSGYVSCGEMGGKQYLLSTDRNGNKLYEFKPDTAGLLTSVLPCYGYFIVAGTREGKMEISKISSTGRIIWDTVFTSSFRVDYTSVCSLGGDNFFAVGSADPDSTVKTTAGLSFIRFDAAGNISTKIDSIYPSNSFVAVKSVVTDNSGNFFMAATRNSTSGKLKASVTKYNSDLQKLWEKELYNNPAFGAASEGIIVDESNNPVVTGRTEMQVSSGIQDNAFVARYFFSGDSIQKCYLEFTNSGSAVLRDPAGQVIVLNKKCLIVNLMDQRMKISGIIRMFKSCDSRTADSFGLSIDLTSDGNIIIAGSKGQGYYLAVKSSTALSPV